MCSPRGADGGQRFYVGDGLDDPNTPRFQMDLDDIDNQDTELDDTSHSAMELDGISESGDEDSDVDDYGSWLSSEASDCRVESSTPPRPPVPRLPDLSNLATTAPSVDCGGPSTSPKEEGVPCDFHDTLLSTVY